MKMISCNHNTISSNSLPRMQNNQLPIQPRYIPILFHHNPIKSNTSESKIYSFLSTTHSLLSKDFMYNNYITILILITIPVLPTINTKQIENEFESFEGWTMAETRERSLIYESSLPTTPARTLSSFLVL